MFKMHNKTKIQAGFTMIELLAVVTIMAILFTIGIVSYTNASRNARNSRRISDVTNIRQALVLYRSDKGFYPDDILFTTLKDYWSEDAMPTDPSTGNAYTYTPAPVGCVTNCTSFTLSATLETTPAKDFIVTNP